MEDVHNTQSPISPSGILETSIYATDLLAAESFYGGLLGLKLEVTVPDRHIFFRCGEGMLLVFNPDATAKASESPIPLHGSYGPGHVCFAANASEIDEWYAKFLDEKIEIDADFLWPNGARSLYISDPAGNSIEFAEPRLWFL